MNNTMTYQGYSASMKFDNEDRIIVGRVLDIDDIIVFHGGLVVDFEKNSTLRLMICCCLRAIRRPAIEIRQRQADSFPRQRGLGWGRCLRTNPHPSLACCKMKLLPLLLAYRLIIIRICYHETF